jgi:hypothetical protein
MLVLLLSCATFDTTLNKAEEDPCEATVWYEDADGDGVGSDVAAAGCDAPSGFVSESGDCDDQSAAVFPGADEACNEIDDDCDGDVDEDATDMSTWYADGDGDGYGDPGAPTDACEQPTGTVDDASDCDDQSAAVFPGADEFCNGIDDDCDLDVDEDPVDPNTWHLDADGDGWGVPGADLEACDLPSGYADNADDCDDTDATLTEVCSGTIVTGATCNGTISQVIDPLATEPELHVLSLYEADLGHGAGAGSVQVHVQRATEMTLVLSSYEPVHWTINAVPGAQINTVLANGYHSQSVIGAGAASVEVRSYDQTGTNFGEWCGYSLPYTGGGCDTNNLIAGVEAYVGQGFSSFTGCYHGTEFLLQ